MRRDDLTWSDIDKLRALTKTDIESTGASIIFVPNRLDEAGYVFPSEKIGLPPNVRLTAYQDRSTIIHEWVHFDKRRQSGYPIFSDDLEIAKDHEFIYAWQIKNADAILGPATRNNLTEWEVYRWQMLLDDALKKLGKYK